MLKLLLCLKYLSSKKVVLFSIISVALSVGLLCVVASIFTAFISAIESGAAEHLGDIVMEPPSGFFHSDIFVEQIAQDKHFCAATPVIFAQGLLHISKGNVKPIRIWGIDPATRSKTTAIKESLLLQSRNGSSPTFEFAGGNNAIPAFVAIGLLGRPNEITDKYDIAEIEAFIGKKMFLTTGSLANTADEKLSDEPNFQKKTAEIIISDIVFSGVHDIDNSFIYLPIDKLAQIIRSEQSAGNNYADIIHIKCADGAKPEDAIEIVWQKWKTFANKNLKWSNFLIAQTNIETSISKQGRYIAELKKQMGMLLLIFAAVSGGAVMLIFCIFYMVVITKQKDIAIIKSIGASDISVAWIFVYFGIAVGICGAAAGTALGYAITVNINSVEKWIRAIFGLKLWSSSVYIFEKIPNDFNWQWAVIAAVLGALAPATAAGRAKPARLLQYE